MFNFNTFYFEKQSKHCCLQYLQDNKFENKQIFNYGSFVWQSEDSVFWTSFYWKVEFYMFGDKPPALIITLKNRLSLAILRVFEVVFNITVVILSDLSYTLNSKWDTL